MSERRPNGRPRRRYRSRAVPQMGPTSGAVRASALPARSLERPERPSGRVAAKAAHFWRTLARLGVIDGRALQTMAASLAPSPAGPARQLLICEICRQVCDIVWRRLVGGGASGWRRRGIRPIGHAPIERVPPLTCHCICCRRRAGCVLARNRRIIHRWRHGRPSPHRPAQPSSFACRRSPVLAASLSIRRLLVAK
jgi:hypothetical protein